MQISQKRWNTLHQKCSGAKFILKIHTVQKRPKPPGLLFRMPTKELEPPLRHLLLHRNWETRQDKIVIPPIGAVQKLSTHDPNLSGIGDGCAAVSSKKLQSETEPFWRNNRTSRCVHDKITLVVSVLAFLWSVKDGYRSKCQRCGPKSSESRCPSAVDKPRSAISQPVRRFWRPIRNPQPRRTVEDHEARNCIEGVRAGAVGNACIPGGSLQELVTISRPSFVETKIVRLVTERRVLEDTLAKVRPRTIVASMR